MAEPHVYANAEYLELDRRYASYGGDDPTWLRRAANARERLANYVIAGGSADRESEAPTVAQGQVARSMSDGDLAYWIGAEKNPAQLAALKFEQARRVRPHSLD